MRHHCSTPTRQSKSGGLLAAWQRASTVYVWRRLSSAFSSTPMRCVATMLEIAAMSTQTESSEPDQSKDQRMCLTNYTRYVRTHEKVQVNVISHESSAWFKCWLSSALALAKLSLLVAPARMRYLVSPYQIHAMWCTLTFRHRQRRFPSSFFSYHNLPVMFVTLIIRCPQG